MADAGVSALRIYYGIPSPGLVVYPPYRRLKRRLAGLLAAHQAGRILFAELDASVQGWIDPVRYADTWGLREHLFTRHPIRRSGE